MQVIKPLEINDSNLTSTIAEPDLTQGESEWIQDRPNFFSANNSPLGVAVIGDVIYTTVDSGDLVQSYNKDGTFIDSFPVATSFRDITTDGIDLYLIKNLTTTTAALYKYSALGAYDSDVVLTFSQAASDNDRAICYKSGVICAYSEQSGVHQTVTEFDPDTGGRITEHDASGTGGGVVGITSDGSEFYLNVGSNSIYSADFLFNSVDFRFEFRINNKFTIGLDFNDSRFWAGTSSIGSKYMGFTSDDGKGLGVYVAGEQAIKISTHKIYQATTNTADDPEAGVLLTPPSWVEVSATNKYRSFDYVKNLQSTGATPLVITVTPAQIVSALAVFNITGATSVNVTMTDPTDGIVYDEDIPMADVGGIINMWQYFIYQPSFIDKFAVDDLPPYPDATITITFTGAGDIGVGEIAIGRGRVIGVMVAGSSSDRKSYSNITIDDFGNEAVTKRPSATYTNYMTSLSTRTAGYVERVLKGVLDEPALFIGDDVDNVKLVDLGYYERSPLVRQNPSLSTINIKVRGLV